jgi:hypothetical protein
MRALILTGTLIAGLAAMPADAQFSKLLDKAKETISGSSGSGSSGATSSTIDALTNGEISAGLKEALRIGTERVVGLLGQSDGFNKDPQIHIPLPDSLKTVQSALQAVGMGQLGEDLELKLNRAAEAATPKAKTLFVDAISEMSLEDAQRILDGPKDSATRYFEGKMTAPLITEMRPIVTSTLSDVGAVQAYDNMMGQYGQLPFVPDVKANLTDYALEKALAGLFHYIAVEEAAIRDNPAKRTTELLQKVFGG